MDSLGHLASKYPVGHPPTRPILSLPLPHHVASPPHTAALGRVLSFAGYMALFESVVILRQTLGLTAELVNI